MFTLFVFFFVHTSLCNIARIAHLAKQAIFSTSPKIERELQHELKKIKAEQLTCINTLFLLIHALIQMPTPVAIHGQCIPSSYKLIHVPGYLNTLRYIAANPYHESIVKGYSYELERALELIETGHKILRFHHILSNGSISREIDIHTDQAMVECKNIKWPNCFNEKLFNQFSDQQRLVEDYNKTCNCSYIFQVSSKQSISERWKKWFATRNINTHESSKK